MDSKVLFKMALVLIVALGAIALKKPLSKISVKAFSSAEAVNSQTISEDEQRLIHHYETLDAQVKKELTTKSRKALVGLSILDKTSDFSACNSICKRSVSDVELDKENLAAYYKKVGAKAFDNPAFVQDLVMAKMLLNNSSKSLIEFEAKGFDVSKVKTNAALREKLLSDVISSANRTDSKLVVGRNDAFVSYVKLNHDCVDKFVPPAEALKTCKQLAQYMDVAF